MADRTILDLTTDDDRPVITIDNIAYPLRRERDLTLQNFKSLEPLSIRIGELMVRTGSLTKEENLEVSKKLAIVARMAVDAPAAVLAKLSDVQRVLVFKVFTELLTPTLILAARAIAMDQTPAPARDARRSPGPKQSPGSYAATAGLLKRGRRGHR